MAKRSYEQQLMKRGWMRIILFLLFLGIAYGFASLAIDSGNLLEYAIALFFLVWAIKQLIRSIRHIRI